VLFATHYHELTEMEERLPGRVRNLHVTVREWGDEVVFLHRIEPGRTDQSYGVHVARLAGVPTPVTERAREVLDSLAVHHGPGPEAIPEARDATGSRAGPDGQLSLFTEFVPHPAVDELKKLDIDRMSPMEAFELLRKLKEMTEGS
jgi:DNA mismatch repair protein MutS